MLSRRHIGKRVSSGTGCGVTFNFWASNRFAGIGKVARKIFIAAFLIFGITMPGLCQDSLFRHVTSFVETKNSNTEEDVFDKAITAGPFSVLITSSQDGNTCIGTPVTFYATVTEGGVNPTFQWSVNGSAAGNNEAVFVSSSLKNGDRIICKVTCTSCTGNPSTSSNTITVVIGSFVVPDITITANPGSSVCANTTVTFTAKAVDASASPYYQWKLNGNYTGTNSPTFTSNMLADGDLVSCDLTNLSCNMTTLSVSNAITMAVSEGTLPAFSITASETNVCKGVPILFSTVSPDVGNNPSYKWEVNGVVTGTNATYSSASLSDNDVVQCILLPEQAGCAGPGGIASNAITISLLPSPDFEISPAQPVIKKGDTLQLSVTGTDLSIYEWSPSQFISNASVNNPKVWPEQTQTYQLTITSDNNCSVSKQVVVSVVTDIFIPGAFTPNSDGLNDTWRIRGIELYPDCTVSIFDRSGTMVFRSAGYSIAWNGVYKGKRLPIGTFVYLINFKGSKKPLCGTVTLLR